MTRTWETNAEEFDQLMKQGKSARLALLVACSVDPTSKGGRPKTVADETVPVKVSASAFARRAKTTADRILRHYQAWEKVANSKDHLVPLASTLKPASAEKFGEITPEAQVMFDAEYRQIVREMNPPEPEAEAAPEPKVKSKSKAKLHVVTEDERPDEQIFVEPEPDNDFARVEAVFDAIEQAKVWLGHARDYYAAIEIRTSEVDERVKREAVGVIEDVNVLIANVGTSTESLEDEAARLSK